MAHDRLKHISIFRAGIGPVLIANDTLGPINGNSAWLVEHLEIALAAHTKSPEQQHEILHKIQKMPWKNSHGVRLNTLRIRVARVKDIASELPAEWFADYPVRGDEVFIISAAIVWT